MGSTAAIILSEDAMAHLTVKLDDTLHSTASPDHGFRLTAHNPGFARQMSRAEEIMHEDREILRRLAR